MSMGPWSNGISALIKSDTRELGHSLRQVRLLVNSRLLVTVKSLGSQNLYMDFHLHGRLVSLTPVLFKGQVYTHLYTSIGHFNVLFLNE